MCENNRKRSASLWFAVQADRGLILKFRASGFAWVQIAGAYREAGFPSATESYVRLAHKAGEKGGR